MKEFVIYRCNTCGNLITMLEDSGVVPVCCGTEMEKLSANTMDMVHEKHVPVLSISGSDVHIKIGQLPHPQTKEHHIDWIALITDRGTYFHYTAECEKAQACFHLGKKETVLMAYAYCNLHGLWKADCQKAQKHHE